MKKFINPLIIFLIVAGVFSSCLKHGLKDLPAYSDKKIDRFDFEHRWIDSKGNFAVQALTTNSVVSNDTIKVSITIPAPSGTFPETERPKVNLSNLVAYCNISTAASVESVDGSPKLGVPGDFSKGLYKYKVTAADGTSKIWTLVIAPLPVINQWEGTYIETGNLEHSANGVQTPPANYTTYLATTGANQLKATAGFWYFNNPGITYFIAINTNNTVTITADPSAVAVVQQDASKASTYDPATKKLDLYYFYYSGGNPVNWRKFHTILTRK